MRFDVPTAALVFALILFPYSAEALEATPDWTSLTVERSQLATVRQALENAGIPFLDAENALVEISNYEGLELVPLRSLPQRFESVDPRWDPYLKELPNLFLSEGFGTPSARVWIRTSEVAKAKAALPSTSASWTRGRGDVWDPSGTEGERSPKGNPALSLVLDGIVWGALWFGLFWSRRTVWTIVLFVVWTALASASAGISFWSIVGATVSFGARDAVRRWNEVKRKRELRFDRTFVFVWGVGVLAFFAASAASWAFEASSAAIVRSAAFAAFAAATFAYDRWRNRQLVGLEHDLFTPVRLTKTSVSLVRFARSVAKPIWGALAAAILAAIVNAAIAVPVVRDVQGSSSAAALYRRHVWYQAAYAYAVRWDDYSRSKSVVLPEYVKSKGLVVERDRVVFQDEPSWWAQRLAEVSIPNAAVLFFPQTP